MLANTATRRDTGSSSHWVAVCPCLSCLTSLGLGFLRSASAILPAPYLSQVSASGKLFTRRKVRLRNLSSLVAEWMLHEELRSSFSAWLRLPRLLEGEASTGWLGKIVCLKFSCRDGLEEPSARGWDSRVGSRLLVSVAHHKPVSAIPPAIRARPGQTGERCVGGSHRAWASGSPPQAPVSQPSSPQEASPLHHAPSP